MMWLYSLRDLTAMERFVRKKGLSWPKSNSKRSSILSPEHIRTHLQRDAKSRDTHWYENTCRRLGLHQTHSGQSNRPERGRLLSGNKARRHIISVHSLSGAVTRKRINTKEERDRARETRKAKLSESNPIQVEFNNLRLPLYTIYQEIYGTAKIPEGLAGSFPFKPPSQRECSRRLSSAVFLRTRPSRKSTRKLTIVRHWRLRPP